MQEGLIVKLLSRFSSCTSPSSSSCVELFSNHLLSAIVLQLNLDLSGSSHQICGSVVFYFMGYKEVAINSRWPRSHFPMAFPIPLVPFCYLQHKKSSFILHPTTGPSWAELPLVFSVIQGPLQLLSCPQVVRKVHP